jgi:hypothetical protein
MSGYALDDDHYQDDPTDPYRNMPVSTFPYDERQFDLVDQTFRSQDALESSAQQESSPGSESNIEKAHVGEDTLVPKYHDTSDREDSKTSMLSLLLSNPGAQSSASTLSSPSSTSLRGSDKQRKSDLPL